MTYKKASARPLPASTAANKEHFKEAVEILAALSLAGVEICFIDEYNINELDQKLYSWFLKGKNG